MLFIQHNLLAQNANRQLNISTDKNAKTTEKLSSGYKINRAADDAAGLSISEKMRRQVRGLHQSVDNISEGVGYVQTAEGALNEVQDMLQRINELAVKAANETNTDVDREYINSEIQALKVEMQRIFSTTSFNDQKIWVPQENKEITGYDPTPPVVFNGNSAQYKYFDITNDNCDIIADSKGYKIDATKDGVLVSWTGNDGKPYSTDRIDWDTLAKNNYSFDVGYPSDDPAFSFNVSMSVHNLATVDDIIAAIDGRTMSSYSGVNMSARFLDANGNPTTLKWENAGDVVVSASLNFAAAYQSHTNSAQGYDFDTPGTKFLEPKLTGTTNVSSPSASTVAEAKNSSETWTFSFDMPGVGTVTAAPSSWSDAFYYTSGDGSLRDSLDKPLWWHTYEVTVNGKKEERQRLTSYNIDKNFAGVMSALTGSRTDPTDNTPGLLSTANGGASRFDRGGSISLSYTLTADSGIEVGSLSFSIPIVSGDKEEDVFNRITGVLNNTTVLDLYTSSSDVTSTNSTSSDYTRVGPASAKPGYYIQVPTYGGITLGGTNDFWVQAGTESGQHISIEYEALTLGVIGLEDTNVLTIESAGNAIDEVKQALQKISEQRSLFGAYQNRLDHAHNINSNVEENTQSAESLIRDTDIADTMVEYSINNILMQAGTSMLTQANQSSQSILQLLQ